MNKVIMIFAILILLVMAVMFSACSTGGSVLAAPNTSDIIDAVEAGKVNELPSNLKNYYNYTIDQWDSIVSNGGYTDYYGDPLELDYVLPILTIEWMQLISGLPEEDVGAVQLEIYNNPTKKVIRDLLPHFVSDPIEGVKAIDVPPNSNGTCPSTVVVDEVVYTVIKDAKGCYYEKPFIYYELDYDKYLDYLQEKYKVDDGNRMELYTYSFELGGYDKAECIKYSDEKYVSNPSRVTGLEIATLATYYNKRLKYCMIGAGFLPAITSNVSVYSKFPYSEANFAFNITEEDLAVFDKYFPEMTLNEINNVGGGTQGCADDSARTTDCSSFTASIYGAYGLMELYSGNSQISGSGRSTTAQYQSSLGKCVSPSDIRPGDLIFYLNDLGRSRGVTVASHVAIYIGDGYRVHASGRVKGVTMDRDLFGSSFQFIKRMIR